MKREELEEGGGSALEIKAGWKKTNSPLVLVDINTIARLSLSGAAGWTELLLSLYILHLMTERNVTLDLFTLSKILIFASGGS